MDRVLLFTDASLTGWGAHVAGREQLIGGLWSN